MSYLINGKKVTAEEFKKNSKGWDFDKPIGFTISNFSPFVSPIDGKYIRNKRDLAAHCRHHDVVQTGDDFITQRRPLDND